MQKAIIGKKVGMTHADACNCFYDCRYGTENQNTLGGTING